MAFIRGTLRKFSVWFLIFPAALEPCKGFSISAKLAIAAEQNVRISTWPHWRGPNRNDVVAEPSGWDGKSWIKDEPLWTANVGEGATSPLVVDGRLYVLGFASGKDSLVCLDAQSGKELWKTSFVSRRHGRHATGDEGLYSGPTSTPEFDAKTGYLYTLGCDGDLHCWNSKEPGKKIWHVNLYDAYKTPQRTRVGRSGHRDYGFTSSPLVYNDWLLVEVGSPQGTVMALDKRTGQRVWASEAKQLPGHSGGLVPMTVGEIPCVALLTFEGLLVVRLDGDNAGKTLALHPWKTDFANNIATPAVHGDSVIITSEYNQNAMCRLRITPGNIIGTTGKAEVVWKRDNMASKTCSPLIHKGRIYYAWDNLWCLDWETGKTIWDGPRVGDAGSCIMTGDDKLIVWCDRGTLLLADGAANTSKYRELARRENLGHSDVWPHVVMCEGRLYCKDRMGNIVCLETNAKAK